ncbi:unnamed protein product [Orchesella dallaii]|uniref:Fibronectin type-III domain-containing protein n=1 Tax=Orchesella dallaii TaxID=48710 RepID=A0ABP1S4V3_9HEXA
MELSPPTYLCKGDGKWYLLSGGCQCKPGYEADHGSQTCNVCPPGRYKHETGDGRCISCPEHSTAPYSGSAECRCNTGYYRTDTDPRSSPCTKPPSAPQNLTLNFVDQSTVMLSWSIPKFPGGRQDTVYRVTCDSCSYGVAYNPNTERFNDTRITISGLNPVSHYHFKVYAENGVTAKAGEPEYVEIRVTTEASVPSSISNVRVGGTGSSEVMLMWEAPEDPFNELETFEIRYFMRGRESNASAVRKGRATNYKFDNLKQKTEYGFQVRAKTVSGWGEFSTVVYKKTGQVMTVVGEEDYSRQGLLITIIAVAVALILVFLCIALASTTRTLHLIQSRLGLGLFSALDSREDIRNELIETFIWDLASFEANLFDQKLRSLELIFQLKPELIESKLGEHMATPLQLVAEQTFENGKQLEIIQMLIDYKANVNSRDHHNGTVLHWAVSCNASIDEVISLITLLIESGAEPNSVNKWGQTFVHYATCITSLNTFQEIVCYLDSIKNTESFTIRDIEGSEVLHLAVFYYEKLDNDTLQIFQSNGVDFNAKQDNNLNVLDCAIGGNQDDSFLKTLIAFGADWESKRQAGETIAILHSAACHGDWPAFKLFKSFGINVNAADTVIRSVMAYAIMNDQNSTFIKKTIGLGADWRMVNKELKVTGLHWAALSGNLSALKLFISLGANVNAKNYYGDTPLHYVFLPSSIIGDDTFEIVKQLVRNGANPNLKNEDGDLPLNLARNKIENQKLKHGVVNLLLKKWDQ